MTVTTAPTQPGYRHVADTVASLHDGPIFGLMGDANLKFLTALKQHEHIGFQASRHEAAAIAMADGWSRATGRVGVASVTQGPGLTNTITALFEAQKGRTPLVLLVGDTPATLGRHNQNIDQRQLIESIPCPYLSVTDPADTTRLLSDAFARAAGERRPVVVGLPTDAQEREAPASNPPAPTLLEPAPPDTEAVATLAQMIQDSARPVFIAGRGAVWAEAEPHIADLATRVGALTATSAQAKGLFADDPYCLGIVGGFSSDAAVALLDDADLVVGFGVSFTPWTTRSGTLFPHAAVASCDVEPQHVTRHGASHLLVAGDASAAAQALIRHAPQTSSTRYRTAKVQQRLQNHRDRPVDTSAQPPVDGGTIALALDRLLPKDKVIAVDSGHFMGHAAIHMSTAAPRRFIFTQDFQSVGLGLASALGASTAHPDLVTVAVIGDGGLLMSLGELETVARMGGRLLVVVMNDSAYAAEYHLLEAFGLPVEGSCFPTTDFAATAAGLGMASARVDTVNDLGVVTPWLSEPSVPLLLDCRIARGQMAPWFRDVFALRGEN